MVIVFIQYPYALFDLDLANTLPLWIKVWIIICS
jgi:hypothetical protein